MRIAAQRIIPSLTASMYSFVDAGRLGIMWIAAQRIIPSLTASTKKWYSCGETWKTAGSRSAWSQVSPHQQKNDAHAVKLGNMRCAAIRMIPCRPARVNIFCWCGRPRKYQRSKSVGSTRPKNPTTIFTDFRPTLKTPNLNRPTWDATRLESTSTKLRLKTPQVDWVDSTWSRVDVELFLKKPKLTYFF